MTAILDTGFDRQIQQGARIREQASLNDYYRGLSIELGSQPERIHSVPRRREEFSGLVAAASEFAKGLELLEIACGVGFWTGKLAACAAHIHATDICEEALAIAKDRVGAENTTFTHADAWNLDVRGLRLTGVFGGFWLSHIKRNALAEFFARLHRDLKAETGVMFVENEYPDRASRPFESVTRAGDTYELRTLRDGSTHMVLKNYFSDAELLAAVGPRATDVKIVRTEYYWSLKYRLR